MSKVEGQVSAAVTLTEWRTASLDYRETSERCIWLTERWRHRRRQSLYSR